MDHHLTRPYKRASSTLSTAERGGQSRRESQSVGNNAGWDASTHVGDGSSRNASSDHHHASPARRVYPQAPAYSSSPYYDRNQYYYSSSSNMHVNNNHFVSNAHGNGATEEFKYARRRRQSSSIGTICRPIFLIFMTIILGSALIIYLRYNGGNDTHVSDPTQAKTTFLEQNTNIDEASKDTKLRGGMSKHERAAAVLLLADIIVHAEHDAEEEILKRKFLASTTGTAPRLGADDDDYFLLASEKNSLPGAGYGYLPYEIDALDKSNLAIGVWIKPNILNGKRNRVIWSTLDSGACGGTSGSSTKDDIGGMELSIEGGQVTLRYISEDGSCQTIVGKQDIVQLDKWNHFGMMLSENGRIIIFRNGNIIATGNAFSRAAHTHSDPIESPSHRPKGKMSRTFVGQRGDGTDGLDGRVALLSIWASDARLDDEIIKNHFERTGRNSSMDDGQEDASLLEPTLMYPFDGETRDGVKVDAVSQLKEMLKGRHGTVRRYVPVEQYSSSKNPESKYSQYASGTHSPVITEKMKHESDTLARSRRLHIKNAMRHAWEGYRTEAWGFDELLPLSAGSKDNWGGMAVTMIDSLSTLWLMGLKGEFYEARDFIQHELSFADVGVVSVFETTIRSLGGLLSAFDLSGDKAFLDKADDLGSRLMKSFNSPSGIPYGEAVINGVDAYNTPWHSSVAILSEAGTMQLEFRYLSQATGKKEYTTKALKVIDELAKMQLSNGLFYLYIQNEKKPPQWGNKKISLGAMGDSMYEYLLKLWLQGKKRETKYRLLYDRAMQGVHDELIKQNPASKLFYIGEQTNGKFEDKMDHLSCFTGGMLALGAATHPKGINSEIAQRDLRTAKSLAFTCYQMYKTSATGMAPEAVWFGKKGIEQRRHAIYSILRPETVETFFVLHQITRDPAYREWGWEIFLALEHFCKTDYAYGSLKDVNRETLDDKMESFALAETLKYLYLLQDPDGEVDILNKHVFTTEAHIFKI